jgi:hypothetical protein
MRRICSPSTKGGRAQAFAPWLSEHARQAQVSRKPWQARRLWDLGKQAVGKIPARQVRSSSFTHCWPGTKARCCVFWQRRGERGCCWATASTQLASSVPACCRTAQRTSLVNFCLLSRLGPACTVAPPISAQVTMPLEPNRTVTNDTPNRLSWVSCSTFRRARDVAWPCRMRNGTITFGHRFCSGPTQTRLHGQRTCRNLVVLRAFLARDCASISLLMLCPRSYHGIGLADRLIQWNLV